MKNVCIKTPHHRMPIHKRGTAQNVTFPPAGNFAQSGATLRLVLDTNVWLDWLVFNDAGIAPLRKAVAQGTARIFISPACEAELARVLAYPLARFTLDAAAQAAALAHCRTLARALHNCGAPHAIAVLPHCDDPDDQMFLELARDCRADVLITKDRDLLALATRKVKPLPFRIVTPREYARDYSQASSIG
jgi:putative PIN family toxin of toxin-antitoxin system